MRAFSGVLTILIAANTLLAQVPVGAPGQPGQTNYPAEMTIVVPEVEIRCGPTQQYYATSKLKQYDHVLVLRDCKDQPGWLAIKPPPGSFSWIKGKYIKQLDANTGYVLDNNGPIAVMPGSSLVEQTPNVESVKVPAGSTLVILDKPFHAEGETWIPIQPPPTEVRYIPATAVSPPIASVQVTPGGFKKDPGSSNSLVALGDQAYRTGNVDLAKQYYRQAIDKAADPAEKTFAKSRLDGMPVSGATYPVWQAGSGATPGTLVKGTGQSTSNYASNTMAQVQPAQWSSWGYLRRATFDREGQPVFVLESKQGQPLIYATGPALKDYVGRFVCLYGPISYQSDQFPRVQFMTTSHVALP